MSLLISPSAFVYIVNVRDVAPAPNKTYVSILNTPSSGLELKIIRAIAWNNQISSSAGGEIGIFYQRIVAQSGGTSRLVVGADSNNAGIPTYISVKEDATITLDNATSGSTYFQHTLVTDDIRGIGNVNGLSAIILNAFLNPLNCLGTSQVQPVVLNPSTGLSITQDAANVRDGKINVQIIFALPQPIVINMTIKSEVTYVQFKSINTQLGIDLPTLVRKVYYFESEASNRFVCMLVQVQNPIIFVFSTNFAGKPSTFGTDFPTAQVTEFIDMGVI